MNRAEEYAERKGQMFFPAPHSGPEWVRRPEFFCEAKLPAGLGGRFRVAWVDGHGRLALPFRRLRQAEALALAQWITETFTP